MRHRDQTRRRSALLDPTTLRWRGVPWLALLGILGAFPDLAADGGPDLSIARGILERAIGDRAFPGCVVSVGTSEGCTWREALGKLSYGRDAPAVTQLTQYDLASLTKVVGTTSVILRLAQDERIDLAAPISRYIPEFLARAADEGERERRRSVTVEHLLTHCAGLVAWRPFYRDVSSYDELLDRVLRTPLERAPGEKTVYSDLGFILLGEIAARVGGRPLPELERSLVFAPLGMTDTLRNPPSEQRPRAAPTELSAEGAEGPEGPEGPASEPGPCWQGVVHDENARAGGGVTGHAGLFSTAGDLCRLAEEILRCRRGRPGIFRPEWVRRFTRRRGLVSGSSRALGWGTPSEGSSAGNRLSPTSFGHTGFTGTSIWLDPDRDVYVILLTNRVHPTRENRKVFAVRRRLADAVADAIDAAASPAPDRPPPDSGPDLHPADRGL